MNKQFFSIEGQIVDIEDHRTYAGRVNVKDGLIESIEPLESAPNKFILPGFC